MNLIFAFLSYLASFQSYGSLKIWSAQSFMTDSTYRMTTSKKILRFRFYVIRFQSWEKNAWTLMVAPKNGVQSGELGFIASD